MRSLAGKQYCYILNDQKADIMTDLQTPRPTLKLTLKSATLESLASKLPKRTVVAKEPEAATPKEEQQSQANNKGGNLKQEQEPKPQDKELLPQVDQPAYDFFVIYDKLHSDFRAVISLKNPKALALGIHKTIREYASLSPNIAKRWIGEYLRRSQYYKKAHIAGADRYNLQGEVVGSVTQEQCDERAEMFENFKKNQKKV